MTSCFMSAMWLLDPEVLLRLPLFEPVLPLPRLERGGRDEVLLELDGTRWDFDLNSWPFAEFVATRGVEYDIG